MRYRYIIAIALFIMVQACKKENILLENASINVVNATVDLTSLITNFTGKTITYSAVKPVQRTNYGTNQAYAVPAGNTNVSIVSFADTSKVLLSENKTNKAGQLNTLFLTGQLPNLESVYLENENFPTYTDEVIGVRVINLSPGSPAVSVNLVASPTVKEVSSLTYKQISPFKTYPIVNYATPISFEIRDAVNGDLLSTYSIPTTGTISVGGSVHKNITIVIKGLVGGTGTNSFGTFAVAHF